MRGSRIKAPPYKSDAHHIVAGGETAAEIARKALEKFNIDIDATINGVFLPVEERLGKAMNLWQYIQRNIMIR